MSSAFLRHHSRYAAHTSPGLGGADEKISCATCGVVITSDYETLLTCTQCDDGGFLICPSCLKASKWCHNLGHKLTRLLDPYEQFNIAGNRIFDVCGESFRMCTSTSTTSTSFSDAPSEHQFICGHCKETIAKKHQVTCTICDGGNFALCGTCEARDKWCKDPTHELVRWQKMREPDEGGHICYYSEKTYSRFCTASHFRWWSSKEEEAEKKMPFEERMECLAAKLGYHVPGISEHLESWQLAHAPGQPLEAQPWGEATVPRCLMKNLPINEEENDAPTDCQSQLLQSILLSKDKVTFHERPVDHRRTADLCIPFAIHAQEALQSLVHYWMVARSDSGRSTADKTPFTIILVPNLEHAVEYFRKMVVLSQATPINPALHIDGDDVPLGKGDITIGTPAGILELAKRTLFPPTWHLLLDGAETLLDGPFDAQLAQLWTRGVVNHSTRFIFSSTTMSPATMHRAARFLHHPAGSSLLRNAPLLRQGNHSHHPPHQLLRPAYADRAAQVADDLRKILRTPRCRGKKRRVLVLCNTRAACDRVERLLVGPDPEDLGLRVGVLHARRRRRERERAFARFSSNKGRLQVLVATPFVADGIALPRINVLLHHDLPAGQGVAAEELVARYVKRNGVLCRHGGRVRTSVAYYDGRDGQLFDGIAEHLAATGQSLGVAETSGTLRAFGVVGMERKPRGELEYLGF